MLCAVPVPFPMHNYASQAASSLLRRRPRRAEDTAEEPCARVLRLLRSSRKGQLLLQQVCDSGTIIQPDEQFPSSRMQSQRSLESCLRDIHACLLTVDEDLTPSNVPDTADQEAVASCQAWLHRLQTFVIEVERDIPCKFEFTTAGCRGVGGVPGAGEQVWRAFLRAVAAEFALLEQAVDECAMQQLEEEYEEERKAQELAKEQEEKQEQEAAEQQQQQQHDSPMADVEVEAEPEPEHKPEPVASQPPVCQEQQPPSRVAGRMASKRVCLRSRLPYKAYWAGRVAL